MIIWFTGISGVGKTTLAQITYKILKKKFQNLIHLDGDQFRKLMNNDLGFSLQDRNTNAKRLINFVQFLSKSKINLIISANLTSNFYRKYCKKNLKNFYEINISTNLEILKQRDKKKIYNKIDKTNIVGYGIKNYLNKTAFRKIANNGSKKELIISLKSVLKEIFKSKSKKNDYSII